MNPIPCAAIEWADQISGPGVPSSSPRGPKRPSAQPGTQKATQPQVRAPPPSSSKLNSIQQNPSAAHSGISDSPARLGIKTEPSVPQTPSRLIRIAPRTPLTNEQKAERLAKLNGKLNAVGLSHIQLIMSLHSCYGSTGTFNSGS